MLAHVNIVGEQLIFLRINDWKGMNWNKNFVAIAVNSYSVIEVFVFVVRSELDIDVFSDP